MEFQKKRGHNRWINNKEQYEALKPVWFRYAPNSAIIYRNKLEDKDDIQQMEHLQQIVSYNEDWTVKLLKLYKTFCADLTWDWTERKREDAKKLTLLKSDYRLITTSDNLDSERVNTNTDSYEIINTFSDPYVRQWALLAMLGCNQGWHWTATDYKNESWEHPFAMVLRWGDQDIQRFWLDKSTNCYICGIKDFI